MTLRRAHSEELLSEVGVDHNESQQRSSSRSSRSKKSSLNGSLGLLQVSDHPRMRHNSADGAEEVEASENNYENFAHELSNAYLWSPVMTNTRDLTNHNHDKSSSRLVQVDLNSTNSDSNSHQSLDHTASCNGILSVNSRPSSSSAVSPERRLDMVLGSEIQFSDQNPGFQQMARPIPTFNSFGIHEEVHRARPAYAPTPSPGGSEDSSAPPLPARQLQANNNLHQTQPHSLPFFPFHQFPGRSVKPMCKLCDLDTAKLR